MVINNIYFTSRESENIKTVLLGTVTKKTNSVFGVGMNLVIDTISPPDFVDNSSFICVLTLKACDMRRKESVLYDPLSVVLPLT
jgi:hypothetical protein